MKELIEKALKEIRESQKSREEVIEKIIEENGISGFHKLTFLAQLYEKL